MEPKDRQTQPDARSQHRAYVLDHVVAGSLTLDQAAKVLGLSTRQVDRLLARYRDGPATLTHGNRGRPPANRIDDQLRRRVVELATTTYAGVNHTHLAELLAEREGVVVAERTLRRILAEASVRPVRTRRPPRHRSRRERMRREGQLLQVDGSRHRWFGPDLPFATLVAGIDDATGRVPGGTFRAQEDAVGYLTFAQTAEHHGLPGAVYSDRHGIFIVERNRAPTLAEQLTGKRSFTQVGRALEEAGIGWIGAHSAEAKGRVERLWGTFQDRLVSELRLASITTIEAANAFLPGFLDRHNERFAVAAAEPELAWRPWPAGLSSEAVFCFHYPRRVGRDATVSWPDGDLALPRRSDGRSWAGRTVILQERLDGSLWVDHDGLCVPVRPAPADAGQLRARRLTPPLDRDLPPDLTELLDADTSPVPEPPSDDVHRPRPDHPWRRYRDRRR
ncbi:MAG: ISNCY family transposase [Acidimicrobiales bacterium]|nr:ISNCY family transposase [Acidimicrobiales bacterium]